MTHTHKFGAAIAAALSAGVLEVQVGAITIISHRGRLKRLFMHFARRFLSAYAEAKELPRSRAAQRRLARAKATLDLIRARTAAIGERRASDAQIFDWGRVADIPHVVGNRKAA